MNRLDFSSVVAVLRYYINPDHAMNQGELLDEVFYSLHAESKESQPGRIIALHPLVQEIALEELTPSIQICHALHPRGRAVRLCPVPVAVLVTASPAERGKATEAPDGRN